jgi:hypothetical protein
LSVGAAPLVMVLAASFWSLFESGGGLGTAGLLVSVGGVGPDTAALEIAGAGAGGGAEASAGAGAGAGAG